MVMPLGETGSAVILIPVFHGTVGQGRALGIQKVLCKAEDTVW